MYGDTYLYNENLDQKMVGFLSAVWKCGSAKLFSQTVRRV